MCALADFPLDEAGMETGAMLDRLGSDLLDVLVEYCDWPSSLALSASSATLRASTTTVDPLGPLLRVAHTRRGLACLAGGGRAQAGFGAAGSARANATPVVAREHE